MNFLAWLRALGKARALPPPAPAVGRSPSRDVHAAQYLNRALAEAREALTVAALSQSLRHSSGYVREAALARCVALHSWENLPDMVERLNDWVPQVRAAAQIALKALLTPTTVPQMLKALPPVRALLRKSRVDHSAWIADFGRSMIAANAAAVIDGVHDHDTQVRRACFELLAQQHIFDATALIERILRSRIDNVLASRALELCATLPVAQRIALYELALASPYATVRAEALRAMLAGEPSLEKDNLARAGMLDTKTHARAVASQYLSQRGIEARQFYRELLAHRDLPVAQRQLAIVALGVRALPEDAALFRQQANSEHPRVRHAALAALLRAAPGDKDATALLALGDSDPAVRQLALYAMLRLGAYMEFDTVAHVLERAGDVSLLRRFASIEWLVTAALEPPFGAAPASTLVRELRRWRLSPEGDALWCQSRYGKGWLPPGVDSAIAAMLDRSDGAHLQQRINSQ